MATVWIRSRMALVSGEDLTPLQRVMIAADSGNGVAVVLDPGQYTFVNADLTVHLDRFPVDEWVCLEAVTAPEPNGIGLSTSRLFDRRGPIEVGVQGLLLARRQMRDVYPFGDFPGRLPSGYMLGDGMDARRGRRR